MNYFYLFLTIFLTCYGQIILKWQILKAGEIPLGFLNKTFFLFHLLFNPWIITVFLAAFLASMSWMLALSKIPLSYAYPLTSLSFIVVSVLSVLLFHESFTISKMIALVFIITGIIILGKN